MSARKDQPNERDKKQRDSAKIQAGKEAEKQGLDNASKKRVEYETWEQTSQASKLETVRQKLKDVKDLLIEIDELIKEVSLGQE